MERCERPKVKYRGYVGYLYFGGDRDEVTLHSKSININTIGNNFSFRIIKLKINRKTMANTYSLSYTFIVYPSLGCSHFVNQL